MICYRYRYALSAVALITGLTALPSAADRRLTGATGAAVDARRAITEMDLFKFVWVADPQISPDGSQIVFVRVNVDEKKVGYESTIWIAKSDGSESPRRLTGGTHDTSPRWAPNGRQLAFVRAVEKEGKMQPAQIYVISMDGGEARAVTDMPRGAGSPVWSPDSKTLAFTATARPSDLDKKKKEEEAAKQGKGDEAKAEGAKKDEKPHESDVKVIADAVYRANGIADGGYVELDRPAHIWTLAVPDTSSDVPVPKQITSGEFTENNVRWAPDGSRVYFVSTRVKEPYYYPYDSDLWAVPAEGGEPARVASIDGPIGDYAFSRDGHRLAFVGTLHGNPVRSYSQSDLWVMDLPTGTPRNLTASYDFDIDGGLGGDQRAPRGEHPGGPEWSGDGKSIFIKVGEQGTTNLQRVEVDSGRVQPVTNGDQEVMSYSADANGQRFAMVLSTQTVIGDLHVLDAASPVAATKKLSAFNDELFDQLTLSEPEEIAYTSFDGKKIQGWILKPPAFDSSKKHPLILEIHGGPHSAYGHTFTHEFQWMAAKGYVVLFTNPRGSSNYGQDFGNIIQFKYPGDDYKDLMAGVDELLKKGYIDENRMGVTGGSGGGLLTNWVVTQTTRFKAAAAQRDISDWANFWYTADFWLYQPVWFHKAPFEDPAQFAQRSPITYVSRVTTPVMFILGDSDYRTPPAAGGEEMFRALKFMKKSAVMVRFPRENHELSRSGEPWHRVERLQHIVGWMDKWLMGKSESTYE
jgi:dipeptidyl aminopeptidase/acylaminoacyl peptidase